MAKKSNRKPRTRSTPREHDQQTEIEMGSSGHAEVVPRQRLFGPHSGRFETERRQASREHGDTDPPVGPGADVAPTALAQRRERERHRLERELGRTPAGEQGTLRDRRKRTLTRDELRQAARQADRNVIGHDVPSRSR